jgi:hypothetical protein
MRNCKTGRPPATQHDNLEVIFIVPMLDDANLASLYPHNSIDVHHHCLNMASSSDRALSLPTTLFATASPRRSKTTPSTKTLAPRKTVTKCYHLTKTCTMG